jgi:hypothetical protein
MPLTMTYKGATLGLAFSLLSLSACGTGAPDPIKSPPVKTGDFSVAADPPGQEFHSSTTVTLTASRPGRIFYSRDGQTPTEQTGILYTAPIELTESTFLSFVAVTDDEAIWSPPQAELYTLMVDQAPVAAPARGLKVDRDSLFIGVSQIDRDKIQHRTLTISGFGTEAVRIDSITLGENPNGQTFWDPSAFTISAPGTPVMLSPGESITVEVTYMPTDTFRSAGLFIRSNEEANDGMRMIEIWGRVLAW